MSRISRFAVQPVTLERITSEDAYEGNTYAPAEQILAVYDPSYSDLGVDSPERRAGTVLTEAEVSLRDKIEGQVVTQVVPRFYRNGKFDHYEVSL